jgi:GR25 family glycosyltransferase involved in LPS biosynthesis
MEKIERIVYINLDRRIDRKLHIETELDKMGICSGDRLIVEGPLSSNPQFERFTAVERPPGQGIVGCGYSHLAVLKMAKERGYSNILILEDDFYFTVSKEEFYQNLDAFFESPVGSDYDVCMLSYNLRESAECPDTPFVRRVRYAQTASGYIVNARYYDALIRLYEWAIPLLDQTGQHWIYANDVVWKSLQEKDMWYCFTLRIGKQLDGFSDNAGCVMRYDC